MSPLQTAVLVLGLSVCPLAGGDFAVVPGTTRIESVFRDSSLVCNCLIKSIDDHSYPVEIGGRPSRRHEVTAQVEIRDIYKSDDTV